MAIINLPHVGETVVEGIIGKWLKKPGDRVEKYEPLVEVVTDKVTMELPSPVSGVLVRIIANEGATVPMGAPIAEMETQERIEGSEQGVESRGQRAERVKATKIEAKGSEAVETPGPSRIGELLRDVRPVGPTGGGVVEEDTVDASPDVIGEEIRLSPAVRRLAAEHNVDLAKVKGSGIGGRITREDVMRYIEERGAGAAATTAQVPPTADEESVALTPIRRIIAANMVRSATEIPHAWSLIEVDVTNLVRYREGIKESFRQREGVDLTYLSFAIKAVAESLKENARLNASWRGDKIIVKKRINIGVAVAASDGLVVPVIKDADGLSIAQLAKALRDLTERARHNRLTLQDVQGGTFTVNNTGALGSVISYPIINYPQAAILTTEAIIKRPVVTNDVIAIRSMMNVCLSFDHRVIDGAEASAFLQAVKRRLEAMGEGTPLY